MHLQITLKQAVSFSGKGLFTGSDAKITIRPAPVNDGIVFKRIDLPNPLQISATVDFVQENHKHTILKKEGICIKTVEHLLSALKGMEIDNALIEIEGDEIPIGDGSSQFIIELLENAGLEKQDEERKFITLKEPLYISDKEIHLIALPSNELRVSYALHYNHVDYFGSQYLSFVVNPLMYKTEIAPSRTYSLYEDIKPFLEQGLIKGGGLENALVIKENKILNPQGLRFKDEMVRHKILDLIGDLNLLGRPLLAHIIAIKSGHFYNVLLVKKILQTHKQGK